MARRPLPETVADEAAPTAKDADPVAIAQAVFGPDLGQPEPPTPDAIYRDSDGKPLPLVVRLAMIMGSLPDFQPEGRNTHFNYKFITDKQVLGAVRPRLARQRILVVPETVVENTPVELTTLKGGHSLLTRMTVTFRIVDGLTGESFTGQAVGYGDDSGDKGANKAYTAALKNFFIKLFEIGGESDLESDEETDKRAGARESGARQVNEVEIGDAQIEGIQKGGRSTRATEAQIARVGVFLRELELNAEATANLIDRILHDKITLGPNPWNDVKDYLDGMNAEDIGALLQSMEKLVVEQTEQQDNGRNDAPYS